MPKLTKEDKQSVRRLLELRQHSKNDRAHYFGVFTIVNSGKPALSPIGKTHWEQLKSVVGEAQVHLRALQLVSIEPDRLKSVHMNLWFKIPEKSVVHNF